MSQSGSGDLVRRIVVSVAEVFCVFGTLVGIGVLGTRVEESSGGNLAADATLIAPASTAFSIWSVIYLGLAAYVIWQWLPANATAPRARATGWWAAASMVLNATWLLVTQQGWIWVSVVVILALAVVLGVLISRLSVLPAQGWADRIVVDATFGLYLGWVAVASCANIAAALVGSGVPSTGPAAEWITVAVLVAVLGLALLFARQFGPRVAVALAITWGVAWIAVGRLGDAPASPLVGWVAAAVAAATLGLTLGLRARTQRHPAPA